MSRRRIACLGPVAGVALAVVAMACRAKAATSDATAAAVDPWVHPPTVIDPHLEYRRYISAEMKREVGYQVCLPPDYSSQPAKRFPVLYWLHDRGGSESVPVLPPALVERAIRDRILPPLIVVYACGGGDSFYTDAVSGGSRASKTFLRELIPEVDRTLRTIASREGRAVQGVGMGGFGAFKFGLSQPEMFSSALSYSGAFFSMTNPEPHVVPAQVLRDVIGRDSFRIATNHPAFLANRNRDRLLGRIGLRLVVSNRDRFAAENRQFRESLRAARLTPDWMVLSTGTNDPVVLVERGGTEGLEFASRWLGNATAPDRDGPWVNAPTNPPPRVRHHLVYSEILGRPIGYSLYLPPGRDTAGSEPLPAIYHLPGRGEDESRYLETVGFLDTAIRIGEIAPTAWVWIYAGRSSWFTDSFDGRIPAETVLMKEVIPRIEERWQVGGIAGRAVDGWGMGGFGALRLAARHPGFFQSVLVHNPLLPDAETAAARLPDAWVAVFNANSRYYAEAEPLGLLARQANELRPLLKIRVVVGQRAAAIADARRLKERLDTLQLLHDYEEIPGAGGAGPELYRHTGLRDLRFLAGLLGKG